MKLVNLGFATLRERVPHLGRVGKKMSKVSLVCVVVNCSFGLLVTVIACTVCLFSNATVNDNMARLLFDLKDFCSMANESSRAALLCIHFFFL